MEQKTYIDRLYDLSLNFGPKVLAAFILLIVGLWVIRRLTGALRRFLEHRNVDDSLRPFLSSMADVALKVALLLVVAGQLGIETTSFIAVFSTIAFAVGLALQGSLGNFASGVLILLFKQFRVGDLLFVEGKMGYVTEIQIFNTVLTTDLGKKIIIPNGKITSGVIENIAHDAHVQVEISILLDSEASLASVRDAVDAAFARCPWHVPGHAAEVAITGLSRDDMKTEIAWWTTGKHYLRTLDFMHESLRDEFETRGIKVAKERRKESVI